MAYEITNGTDYISITDTLDKSHKLVVEEHDKFLLFSVEFKNEHNNYFDDKDKRLIHEILETGTKQQLAELLNLQFQTEYESLKELLIAEGKRRKYGRIEQI